MSTTAFPAFHVFKNKPFAKFARKARIPDAELWKAATAANAGRVDADLGGGVIKQRIARAGEGKSGGSRSIILFRKGDRAIFVFGFEKKDMANISASDVRVFREYAALYLNYSLEQMDELVSNGTLQRVASQKEETHV